MSFNIQIIEDLSISHFVVVVAITMVTVVTTIVVKDCVSALKRFLSNQKNSKYSKIFLEDIITILGDYGNLAVIYETFLLRWRMP
jgi:hypothetical protein